MIVIIDYGMGNLGSIFNMLKKIGSQSLISSKIEDIENADKLILPGVGAFDNGMKNLESTGLKPALTKKVLTEKTPILGICLGMQLFTKCSEEGHLKGLSWVDGETMRFKYPAGQNFKIPHMGWNTAEIVRNNILYKDVDEEMRFYFVHSYHVVCQPQYILTKTNYGYDFTSSLQKDNIWGVQFHPEKSHKFGMKILKNFVELA